VNDSLISAAHVSHVMCDSHAWCGHATLGQEKYITLIIQVNQAEKITLGSKMGNLCLTSSEKQKATKKLLTYYAVQTTAYKLYLTLSQWKLCTTNIVTLNE